MDKEVRNLPVELRVEGEGEKRKIVGHAAVFNSLSEDFGGWREMIAPGAFSDALEDDVRALFNHSEDHVLGRTKSGTLRLSEDDTGLAIEIDPPDTQTARDLMTLMARGDIDQMSFGFTVAAEGRKWDETDDGAVRTITKVSRLFDVSPVTFPAYPSTDVALRELRSLHAAQQEDDEDEAEVYISVLEAELNLLKD